MENMTKNVIILLILFFMILFMYLSVLFFIDYTVLETQTFINALQP